MNQRSNPDDAAVALDLLNALGAVYHEMTVKEKARGPKGLQQMFSGWFSSGGRYAVPMEQVAFFAQVESIVTRLTSVLGCLRETDPARCHAYTRQALELLLSLGSDKAPSGGATYLIVAGYQSAALFSFASPGDLEQIRKELLRRTPRRMMFPKEREMLAQMETVIAENGGQM